MPISALNSKKIEPDSLGNLEDERIIPLKFNRDYYVEQRALEKCSDNYLVTFYRHTSNSSALLTYRINN